MAMMKSEAMVTMQSNAMEADAHVEIAEHKYCTWNPKRLISIHNGVGIVVHRIDVAQQR